MGDHKEIYSGKISDAMVLVFVCLWDSQHIRMMDFSTGLCTFLHMASSARIGHSSIITNSRRDW